MYEMPLIYVFEVCGFGVGESIFGFGVYGVGILSLAFCPEIEKFTRICEQCVYSSRCGWQSETKVIVSG